MWYARAFPHLWRPHKAGMSDPQCCAVTGCMRVCALVTDKGENTMRVRDRAVLRANEARRKTALLWVCVVLVVLTGAMVLALPTDDRVYGGVPETEPSGMFNPSADLDTSRITDLRGFVDCRVAGNHVCGPGNAQGAEAGCYHDGDLVVPWSAEMYGSEDVCVVFGEYEVPGGVLVVFEDASAVFLPS